MPKGVGYKKKKKAPAGKPTKAEREKARKKVKDMGILKHRKQIKKSL